MSSSISSSTANIKRLKAEVEELEAKINSAPSREDALELAINAAELCMRALKIATDSKQRSDLNARCKALLSTAERIKVEPTWTPSPLAKPFQPSEENSTFASHRSTSSQLDPSTAEFKSGVRFKDVTGTSVAAQSRSTTSTWKDISKSAASSTPKLAPKQLAEPVSTRQQSKAEQIIVLRASQLNGFTFPPWNGPPGAEQFEPTEKDGVFYDSPDLVLSSDQLKMLEGWRRAQDALPPPTWPERHAVPDQLHMLDSKPLDFVQDVATDCSVVAGLCAAAARFQQGHPMIMSKAIFPYDNGPQISPNGKYIFKMNFNGCYRKVVIDDRLPVSKTHRVLHVVDRNDPTSLWPALLEKAYLKIRGGYAFPGSNPSTDLWVITGWIPEQVFIQDDRVDPVKLWTRILRAHRTGDVLVNLGTGHMSRRVEKGLGLAEQHAYAVLDLKEQDEQKLLLLKNPWMEGTSRRVDRTRPRADTADSFRSEDGSENTDLTSRPSRFPSSSVQEDEWGTFWIDINNVMQNFESFYLNWNPGLFSHRQDIHFSWDLSDPVQRGSQGCVANNPQFVVRCNRQGPLWLLLCRHFKSISPPSDELLDLRDNMTGDLSGHIGIYVYDRLGQRVYLSDGVLERGPDVDSPQTLLRLNESSAGTPYTIVPSEQNLSASLHTFTLSAFTTSPVNLEVAPSKYAHTASVTGSWTVATAGGNGHSPTFTRNPQFSLATSRPTSLNILLETRLAMLNVNVKLVRSSGGKRIINTLKRREILTDSGPYRRQSCLAELENLQPGTYTIIASTFEPNQLGSFWIRVHSTEPVVLKQLPPENAGKLLLELPPARFPSSANKIACLIKPKKLLRLSFTARFRSMSSVALTHNVPPLRLSVEIGREPNQQVILQSDDGEFGDAAAGIRTLDVDLSPEMRRDGDLSVVLERLVSQSGVGREGEQYVVEMWVEGIADADKALAVGKGWIEWD